MTLDESESVARCEMSTVLFQIQDRPFAKYYYSFCEFGIHSLEIGIDGTRVVLVKTK